LKQALAVFYGTPAKPYKKPLSASSYFSLIEMDYYNIKRLQFISTALTKITLLLAENYGSYSCFSNFKLWSGQST